MKKTAKQVVRGSDRAAKDFVSRLGGQTTRASGSGLEKGDGRVRGKFRTETKCPPTGSYRVTLREWEKLWRAATSGAEVPLLHLKLHDVELVVLRRQDFTGFGGEIHPNAWNLGIQKGHTISKHFWMEMIPQTPHILFTLTDGNVLRNFILISRTECIKLLEATC